MELELGLALSNTPPIIPKLEELDLISYVDYKGKQAYEEDNNSSSLSFQSCVDDDYCVEEEEIIDGIIDTKEKLKNKRGFDEVHQVQSFKTLPLLLWDKHPNDDGDDDDHLPKRLCNSTPLTVHNFSRDEGYCIVGWPPIKAYRKKVNDAHHQVHHHQQQQRRRGGNFPSAENGRRSGGSGGSRSLFVKVQMKGFFITRKIDLKIYHSYEALICSLLTMFGKGNDSVDDYTLSYQDGDGDWLLAGDVPWRTFMESVQRLKIRRRED